MVLLVGVALEEQGLRQVEIHNRETLGVMEGLPQFHWMVANCWKHQVVLEEVVVKVFHLVYLWVELVDSVVMANVLELVVTAATELMLVVHQVLPAMGCSQPMGLLVLRLAMQPTPVVTAVVVQQLQVELAELRAEQMVTTVAMLRNAAKVVVEVAVVELMVWVQMVTVVTVATVHLVTSTFSSPLLV